jgi:hypothetical protein
MSVRDLTGQRSGRLVVLGLSEKTDKFGRTFWCCMCDCVKDVVVRWDSLVGKSRHTYSCGCIKNVSIVGDVFGNLTVVCKSEKRNPNKRAVYWDCICKCGKQVSVETNALRSGHTVSCGCVRREVAQIEWGVASFNQILCSYKRGAKKRNLEFTLTKDEFYSLVTKNCYYCNSEPLQVRKSKTNSGDFMYNGIDRVDSKKGYILDNVVSCCGRCNVAKMAMSQSDFFEWAIRIHDNLKIKNLIK